DDAHRDLTAVGDQYLGKLGHLQVLRRRSWCRLVASRRGERLVRPPAPKTHSIHVLHVQKSVMLRSSWVRRRLRAAGDKQMTASRSPCTRSMNAAARPSRVKAPAQCSASPDSA